LYSVLIQGDANRPPLKEIYFSFAETKDLWARKKFRLDLQTYNLSEIKGLGNTFGSFKNCANNTWYYIDQPYVHSSKNPTVSIYRMNEGIPTLIKKFDMAYGDEKWNAYSNWIDVFDNGLILKNNGKIHVYSLPDMNEMRFKKLN
jgi:hypothetical protein